MPISASALRRAAEALNNCFDEQEVKAILEAVNTLNDNIPAATLTAIGGVKKAAANTDVPTAAPAGGTGAAAGGWDTAANRDIAIGTINTLRTQLNALQAAMRTAGFLNV